MPTAKGAFFQKVKFVFQISKLFQKTILSLKFEIPDHISKQIIQISSSGYFLEYFFLRDLKNESHIVKKATFS